MNIQFDEQTYKKAMSKYLLLILFLLTLCATAYAQSDYSPCYKENLAAGDAALKQCDCKAAKSYYVKAKHCKGGNPAEAKEKIEWVKENSKLCRFIQRFVKRKKRDYESAAKRRHDNQSGNPYYY